MTLIALPGPPCTLVTGGTAAHSRCSWTYRIPVSITSSNSFKADGSRHSVSFPPANAAADTTRSFVLFIIICATTLNYYYYNGGGRHLPTRYTVPDSVGHAFTAGSIIYLGGSE
eukprot:GHVU01173236.1.p2 GENE.GHVU01173236.1~~GHVU01173236.1.p2  ORF type:complete len:114 (+),score=6.62 GHVU01173236.1:297-638(+)